MVRVARACAQTLIAGLLAALCLLPAVSLAADDGAPRDARLKPLRDLYDKSHPWTPPASKAEWEQAAGRLREQAQVAAGLWPMPERTPLEPVIHGAVDRGDYTVERVYFASLPGHYVTGSLYRPKHQTAKLPAVLCPHGHWKDGRFHDAGPDEAKKQLESGAEQFLSGARHPLQARMVGLVRMGCVVFHYDMIGYADSAPLAHRSGFLDADASLWLHGNLGLQTWNSIRALDFVTSLPDVDPARIGVTGASGGGTQTFMLCAVDPRPSAAFPAVMVSTGMQGGCACENADYLRIDCNNIALAALFAPKPMAMSGANDWTIEIETKGLPELKQIYGYYGQADHVAAKCWPQFMHNFNQVSREMMFNWFNEHLHLGRPAPVRQPDFWPLTKEELTVFDAQHPLPKDALPAAELRAKLRDRDRQALAKLLEGPREEYRRVLGGAARVMLRVPGSAPVVKEERERSTGSAAYRVTDFQAECEGASVPTTLILPTGGAKQVVLWLDGAGRESLFREQQPRPAVQKLLAAGLGVASADLFLTGSEAGIANPYVAKLQAKNPGVAVEKPGENSTGSTYGYNRPLLAERVRDIVSVLRVLRDRKYEVTLVGTGEAGAWTLLARGPLPEDAGVKGTIVDLNGFGFSRIESLLDVNLLPGALKYGGLGGLAGLAAPAPLTIGGVVEQNASELAPLQTLYADQPGKLQLVTHPLTSEEVVQGVLGVR
jgi:hypothetical protein